jgi:two-component system sensor kinase FixL
VIETAVDGIVIIDAIGNIRLFNTACERLFGYSQSQVTGCNVKMLMPSPYAVQHDGYLAHYRTTGEKRIIGIGRHVEGRRADGSIFPMYLSVGEVASEGEERLFVGIIRDTTEQQAAERVLREQSERLRSIIETVPDAIIIIDEQGLIESFSPAAERLFGWSSDEVVGRNVSVLMPSPYGERHDAYLNRYRSTGEKRIIGIGRVVVGLRRDASTFPMELAVGEMNLPSGRSFTGFVRDLTERQDTDKRLQELQTELLHVARLSDMGQMASALAHELNQPLAAIINWTQAARRMIAKQTDNPPPKVMEFMDNAIAQADRAGLIIRRLRDFIERGEIERQGEDIGRVVEEATALALVGAKQSGVRVTFELSQALPAVLTDKVQIQQVIINLVRNAVEAMADSHERKLTIGTKLTDDGMVEVSVADTGPGLPAEVAAKLFQPFVTTKEKGMGLGLSISRSIIDNFGGRLVSRSNPGGGVIFSFTLPPADQDSDDNEH